MEPIVSGTTTERIARTTLVTVLVSGFAIWFLWDGYVRYPRDNARQLLESLGLDRNQTLTINPKLTTAEARRLMGAVRNRAPYDEAEAVLGDPAIEHGDQAYYLGPGGHLRLRVASGRVAAIAWIDGVHSEMSQALQRWLGYVLGLFGLILLVRFVRVVTTRVSLTDAGLKVRGHPTVPFSAIKSLRRERSGKIGLIDLGYEVNGQKRVARLDNYVINKYDAVLTAICEQTGLADPRRADD